MGVANASWVQLEPGTFEARCGSVDAAPLVLRHRTFTVGFKAEAGVPPRTQMIGIAADSRTSARWFGSAADVENIAASCSSVEVSTVGPSAFYTVSVDVPALARCFPNAPDTTALLDALQPRRLSRDPLSARRLRTAMSRAFARPDAPAAALHGSLVPLLSSALGRMDSHAVEHSKCLNRRLAAVRTCERYMREHAGAGLTLLDLSEIAGMRSRSLINAFEAVTGFSPMDYLKRIRLDGARRALRRADKATTRIIDVASDWGFWHMGHFALDYRAMFGETPSQTLLA